MQYLLFSHDEIIEELTFLHITKPQKRILFFPSQVENFSSKTMILYGLLMPFSLVLLTLSSPLAAIIAFITIISGASLAGFIFAYKEEKIRRNLEQSKLTQLNKLALMEKTSLFDFLYANPELDVFLQKLAHKSLDELKKINNKLPDKNNFKNHILLLAHSSATDIKLRIDSFKEELLATYIKKTKLELKAASSTDPFYKKYGKYFYASLGTTSLAVGISLAIIGIIATVLAWPATLTIGATVLTFTATIIVGAIMGMVFSKIKKNIETHNETLHEATNHLIRQQNTINQMELSKIQIEKNMFEEPLGKNKYGRIYAKSTSLADFKNLAKEATNQLTFNITFPTF